jgi:hypothetical protein
VRLVRRLPTLVCDAGYDLIRLRSHGYAEADDAASYASLIARKRS